MKIFKKEEEHIDFRVHLFEFVQLLREAGYVCWKASDGISVHFQGGKVNKEILDQAKKLNIILWDGAWEERVLGRKLQ